MKTLKIFEPSDYDMIRAITDNIEAFVKDYKYLGDESRQSRLLGLLLDSRELELKLKI